jgi:hypothetical protein
MVLALAFAALSPRIAYAQKPAPTGKGRTMETTSVREELAASRRGDSRARRALLERIERADPDDLGVVLSSLGEVDAPEVLQLVARVALDDERVLKTPGLAGKRICDAAVDALRARLNLAPQPAGAPYGKDVRDSVRAAVRSSVPM